MNTGKQPHILSASSNLIGICFVIMAGLKITDMAHTTFADEICTVAAFSFLCACILSYASIRVNKRAERLERLADYIFLASLILLFVGITLFARDIL
jgi:predicted transporter